MDMGKWAGEALRRIVDSDLEARAEQLDKETRQFYRRVRYLSEKDTSHGMLHYGLTPDVVASETSKGEIDTSVLSVEREPLFWDVLREAGHEAALYLVLRYCLGYSITEVSAGLGVSFQQVYYVSRRAREAARERGG